MLQVPTLPSNCNQQIAPTKIMSQWDFNGQAFQGYIDVNNEYVISERGDRYPRKFCKILNIMPAQKASKFDFKLGQELGAAPGGMQIPELKVGDVETAILVTIDGTQYEAKLSGTRRQVFIPILNRTVDIYCKSNPTGYLWKPKKAFTS